MSDNEDDIETSSDVTENLEDNVIKNQEENMKNNNESDNDENEKETENVSVNNNDKEQEIINNRDDEILDEVESSEDKSQKENILSKEQEQVKDEEDIDKIKQGSNETLRKTSPHITLNEKPKSIEELLRDIAKIKEDNLSIVEEIEVLLNYRNHVRSQNTLLEHQFKAMQETSETKSVIHAEPDKSEITPQGLTMFHKYIIGKTRLDSLKQKLEEKKTVATKNFNQITAKLEVLRQIQKDIRTEKEEFTTTVMIKHPLTKKEMTEKVENYFIRKIKKKDYTVLKIKATAANLRCERIFLRGQTEEKLEEHQQLSDIEIKTARAENVQARELSEREEKVYCNQRTRLNQLMHKLTELKKQLNAEETEREKLNKKIQKRERSKEIFEMAKSIMAKNRAEYDNLTQQISVHPFASQIPEIMNYVNLRHTVELKRKQVEHWRKRVESIKLVVKHAK